LLQPATHLTWQNSTEKAHRLMFRADAAVHKAVFAVMTAVAVKASYMESNDNPNGDE
ncbi:hypothetical protein SLA2020_390500, partial [Shorea laevis]